MNKRTAIHEERERIFLYLPNSAAVQHMLNQLDVEHDALEEECQVCKHDRELLDD